MRFTFVSNPTDGAIVPHVIEEGTKAVGEAVNKSISDQIAQLVAAGAHWLATDGLTLATEVSLVFGMGCFLIAITGSGKWLERGTKYVLLSVCLGVVRVIGLGGV